MVDDTLIDRLDERYVRIDTFTKAIEQLGESVARGFNRNQRQIDNIELELTQQFVGHAKKMEINYREFSLTLTNRFDQMEKLLNERLGGIEDRLTDIEKHLGLENSRH